MDIFTVCWAGLKKTIDYMAPPRVAALMLSLSKREKERERRERERRKGMGAMGKRIEHKVGHTHHT